MTAGGEIVRHQRKRGPRRPWASYSVYWVEPLLSYSDDEPGQSETTISRVVDLTCNIQTLQIILYFQSTNDWGHAVHIIVGNVKVVRRVRHGRTDAAEPVIVKAISLSLIWLTTTLLCQYSTDGDNSNYQFINSEYEELTEQEESTRREEKTLRNRSRKLCLPACLNYSNSCLFETSGSMIQLWWPQFWAKSPRIFFCSWWIFWGGVVWYLGGRGRMKYNTPMSYGRGKKKKN